MYMTEIKYTTWVSHMIKSSLSILCSLSLFGYTAVTIVMVCPHPFLSEGCLSCQVLSNGHLSPRQPQSSALHAWSMRLSAVLFLNISTFRPGEKWQVFFHFVGATPGSTDLAFFLQRLTREINPHKV